MPALQINQSQSHAPKPLGEQSSWVLLGSRLLVVCIMLVFLAVLTQCLNGLENLNRIVRTRFEAGETGHEYQYSENMEPGPIRRHRNGQRRSHPEDEEAESPDESGQTPTKSISTEAGPTTGTDKPRMQPHNADREPSTDDVDEESHNGIEPSNFSKHHAFGEVSPGNKRHDLHRVDTATSSENSTFFQMED